MILHMFEKKEALISCLEKPARNAGDSPECMYYDKKESLEKEGKFVGQLVVRISGALSVRRLVRQLVCQSSSRQPVNQ